MNTQWFDIVPLWGMFLGIGFFVLLSIGLGFGLGLWRSKQTEGALAGPVGSITGAMLGLLAFMLAFTFSMAAGRFDARKQLLLEEVNTLETAFFRAGLIKEPYRTECRQILKKYTDLRVFVTGRGQNVKEGVAASEKFLDHLREHAYALAKSGADSEIYSLFYQSVGDLAEVHTRRVTTGLQYRIPRGVWSVLFLLTFFSMATVGYQFGICGRNSFIVYFFLAIGFSLVITIIINLDCTSRGGMTVNQQPMVKLQQRLNAAEQ